MFCLNLVHKNTWKKNLCFGDRHWSPWRKISVSDEHTYLNEDKIKYLQIIEDTITLKCGQKH